MQGVCETALPRHFRVSLLFKEQNNANCKIYIIHSHSIATISSKANQRYIDSCKEWVVVGAAYHKMQIISHVCSKILNNELVYRLTKSKDFLK